VQEDAKEGPGRLQEEEPASQPCGVWTSEIVYGYCEEHQAADGKADLTDAHGCLRETQLHLGRKEPHVQRRLLIEWRMGEQRLATYSFGRSKEGLFVGAKQVWNDERNNNSFRQAKPQSDCHSGTNG
jgi:hypothetical protein